MIAAIVEYRPSSVLNAAVDAGSGRCGESAHSETGVEGAKRAADAANRLAAAGRGGIEAADGGRPAKAGANEGGMR